MNDRWDEIEASLRRQLEPPSLDSLNARVARAALQASADNAVDARARPRDELTDHEQVKLSPTRDDPGRASTGEAARARPWFVGAALVAAAAAALLIWWPSSTEPARSGPAITPTVASRELAGRQLDAFLRAGATLPSMELACTATEGHAAPPPQVRPALAPSPGLELRGECGDATGIDCSAHALPAQRAMLVRVEPEQVDVIVCIEPPELDTMPLLPAASRYTIFERRLGDFVIYEVSPLAEPRVLEHLAI